MILCTYFALKNKIVQTLNKIDYLDIKKSNKSTTKASDYCACDIA